jgi:hypothetical protein
LQTSVVGGGFPSRARQLVARSKSQMLILRLCRVVQRLVVQWVFIIHADVGQVSSQALGVWRFGAAACYGKRDAIERERALRAHSTQQTCIEK